MRSEWSIWDTFALAVGTEPRQHRSIRGISGLDHDVQSISVDEKGKRLVVVAAEPNARNAALMQVDIQATLKDVRVIVARPIAVDVGHIARRILEPFGIERVEMAEAKRFLDRLQKFSDEQRQELLSSHADVLVTNAPSVFKNVSLPTIELIVSVVQQAEKLPWNDIMSLFEETIKSGTIDFTQILKQDTIGSDLAAGVCPIPLFEFSDQDFDIFVDPARVEAARERLRELGVYQYFFPPKDQLALGLIDHGIGQSEVVLGGLEESDRLGHPLANNEFIDSASSIPDMLRALQEIGYVAEGEHGIELSQTGRTVRHTVKYKPRESLLTKIVNRLSINASVSPSDFIR